MGYFACCIWKLLEAFHHAKFGTLKQTFIRLEVEALTSCTKDEAGAKASFKNKDKATYKEVTTISHNQIVFSFYK